MPLSPERKQRSRDKILKSAFCLFTRQGYENTSIDQVMQKADLTRGAFYAHFSSKSDLYKQAMLDAAANSRLLQSKLENFDEKQWMELLVKEYLSMEHVNFDAVSCPLAFLTTDVAVRDPDVRKTYTRIYKNMNKLIAGYSIPATAGNRDRTLALTALLIGGVAIARALNDKTLKMELLAACQTSALSLLNTN